MGAGRTQDTPEATLETAMADLDDGDELFEADLLVIGGGTAGPLAAYKAKAANPALKVVLLEKANVKRSGAIAIGIDGLNNAVVPGFATPEQYVGMSRSLLK
jgi:succinate dehydrogenase/fumarate reductase flavoprotein subunit